MGFYLRLEHLRDGEKYIAHKIDCYEDTEEEIAAIEEAGAKGPPKVSPRTRGFLAVLGGGALYLATRWMRRLY